MRRVVRLGRPLHRVYFTLNSEYHIRRGRCVGVRDRTTGRWKAKHRAIGQRIAGSVRIVEGRIEARASMPREGDRICFEGSLVTTTVMAIVDLRHRNVLLYPVPNTA